MTSLAVALGALSLLTLLSLVLAATALCQGRAVTRTTNKRREGAGGETESAITALRADLDGLAAQIHDMQQLPGPAPIATPPRGSLNLAKRSQALRLHRHGNSSSQIASALEIPQQEVELLLKVHRIVIRNL
jgi:hypothetical protein